MKPEDAETYRRPASHFSVWRAVLIGLMLLGTGSFFALGLHRYLSFAELSHHRDVLMAWRDQHELAAVLVFMGLYLVVVALSVPGACWLTIVGGFLFGVVPGTAYSVAAATLGAGAVFLAARYLVGDPMRAKAGAWIGKMEAGFREHAFSYLMVLRLLPIFPFWLVNLVPAFLDVPLRTFVIGTLLGIIPGTLVYTLVGNGLGAVIAAGGEPDLAIIFKPQVLAPIVGLALLSLAPVFYRRLKRQRRAP